MASAHHGSEHAAAGGGRSDVDEVRRPDAAATRRDRGDEEPDPRRPQREQRPSTACSAAEASDVIVRAESPERLLSAQLAADQAAPDQLEPDQLLPLQLLPDQLLPDQLLPLQLLPDQLLPDHVPLDQLEPDQLLPAQTVPLQLFPTSCCPTRCCRSRRRPTSCCRRFGRRHRGRVERLAEDVLLAGEHDAVAGQVIAAARELERAGAGRVAELLRVGRAAAGGQHRAEVDLAAALRRVRLWPDQAAALLVKNRLTWSGVSVGYFWRMSATAPEAIAAASRGAAAAEVAAVDERPSGCVCVDVRVRDAQALQVRARARRSRASCTWPQRAARRVGADRVVRERRRPHRVGSRRRRSRTGRRRGRRARARRLPLW